MKSETDRLYLLDWLKILILAAIQTLHMNEFVFFEDDFPLLENSLLYRSAYYYARFFSLGGQGLVAVSYLLFGLSGKSRTWLFQIAGFALVGQLLLTFAFNDKDYLAAVEWDIYLYIFSVNLLLAFLPRRSWGIVGFSLVMLFISPSFWKNILPEGFIGDLLTGRSELRPSTGWAPLPWAFLSLLFFQLGTIFRDGHLDLKRWARWEVFLWPILLGLTLPFLGHYYWTPIGARYYEYTFHEPAHLFWANFLPYLFVMRLAFIDSVRTRLLNSPLSRFVSHLKWSRNVGAVYIVSILYVGFLARFDTDFRRNVYLFDLLFLSVMPVTEILVRLGSLAVRPVLKKK